MCVCVCCTSSPPPRLLFLRVSSFGTNPSSVVRPEWNYITDLNWANPFACPIVCVCNVCFFKRFSRKTTARELRLPSRVRAETALTDRHGVTVFASYPSPRPRARGGEGHIWHTDNARRRRQPARGNNRNDGARAAGSDRGEWNEYTYIPTYRGRVKRAVKEIGVQKWKFRSRVKTARAFFARQSYRTHTDGSPPIVAANGFVAVAVAAAAAAGAHADRVPRAGGWVLLPKNTGLDRSDNDRGNAATGFVRWRTGRGEEITPAAGVAPFPKR